LVAYLKNKTSTVHQSCTIAERILQEKIASYSTFSQFKQCIAKDALREVCIYL